MNGYIMSSAYRMHNGFGNSSGSRRQTREEKMGRDQPSHSRHTKMSHVYSFPPHTLTTSSLVDLGFFLLFCVSIVSWKLAAQWLRNNRKIPRSKLSNLHQQQRTHEINDIYLLLFYSLHSNVSVLCCDRVSSRWRRPIKTNHTCDVICCTKYHVQIALFVWSICLLVWISLSLSLFCQFENPPLSDLHFVHFDGDDV